MDGTTADIMGLRIPEDDGSIAKAITQLDAKLSAWSSAMREAQRQLKGRLEQGSLGEVVDFSESHCASSAGVASLPAEPVSVSPADATADAVEPMGIACPPEESVTDVAAVVPQEDNSAPSFSEEDEEAFLANLEPGVAMKIRVMRRLSTTKKSVRVLLEELEGRTTADREEESKKSSWFTGGR